MLLNMSKSTDIHSILLIGSGPIVIGRRMKSSR